MTCRRELVFDLFLAVLFCAPVTVTGQDAETGKTTGPEMVSYSREIWPVLQRHCQGCHQPALKKGYLDVTSYRAFIQGGMSGAAFVPGKPSGSLLIGHLTGDQKPRMPVDQEPLSAGEIELFRKWIEQGAEDDTPAELRKSPAVGEPSVYSLPPVITALAYSPDGSHLAVSGYREVLLHSVDGSRLEARLPGLSDRIQSLCFLPDGKTLIVAGGTPAQFGEIQFWDIQARELKNSVTVCYDTVFGASLSPDSSRVAVGCSDKTVRVLEVDTGREVLRVSHHENWVLGTAFTLDGANIVSVGRDRAAKVVNASTGAFVENINRLRGELSAIAHHPTRSAVVIGGEDRIPFFYRTRRPRKMSIDDDTTLIREFEKQDGEILGLAFSPRGDRLAVATATGRLSVYDTEGGERLFVCGESEGGLYTVAFHPAGHELATGGFDGTVRIYETDSGKLQHEFLPVPIKAPAEARRRPAGSSPGGGGE